MDLAVLQANYEHKNLVNDPPFITNHPVHEKLHAYKKELNNNELDLFRIEHAKEKKDNNFITICVIGAIGAFIATGIYIYKKIKSGIKKIK